MLHIGDCRAWARGLAPGSVQTIVTSPPYFGLRSYLPSDHPDKARELGGEKTPDEFVANLVALFRDLRAALRDDGTLWLNLGDSYAGSWGNYGGQNRGNGTQREIVNGSQAPQQAYDGLEKWRPPTSNKMDGIKPKDLIGIPWMTAFALRADGWYLRSAITWCKRAPMPESVTDRPTSATEMVFLLTKSPRYYYDSEAIAEPLAEQRTPISWEDRKAGGAGTGSLVIGHSASNPRGVSHNLGYDKPTRNARNFWLLGPSPYPDAHFATFPPEIPRRAIRAGTSEKGACAACGAPWRRRVERGDRVALQTRGEQAYNLAKNGGEGFVRASNFARDGVMPGQGYEYTTVGWEPSCRCNAGVVPCTVCDPFMGSGTTAAVAVEENRAWVGCDLDARAAGWLAGRLARVQRRLPLAV
jgi:DNA modification methylase